MQTHGYKNITRYTYTKTSFQGWRVCISRNRQQVTRYFSDKVYGSEEQSLEAALELRDRILDAIKAAPEKTKEILEAFEKKD